jgi:TolA-binding protein
LGVGSGCDTRNEDGTSTIDARPAKALGFDQLIAEHATVLEQLPDHPESEQVVAQILNAASQEGRISGPDGARKLAALYPNDNLGIYLFQQVSKQEMDKGGDGAKRYCEEVRAAHPGTTVAAAAFDRLLDVQRSAGNAAYREACMAALSPSESPEGRIALLRLIELERESADWKAGTLNCLRFWARWPGYVEEMGFAAKFCGTLRRAGYLLESDLLETSPNPGKTAEALVKLFDDPAQGGGLAYVSAAPDLEAIEALRGEQSEIKPFDDLLYRARVARLAVDALDQGLVVSSSSELAQRAEVAGNSELLDASQAELIGLCCEVAQVKLLQLFGDWSFERSGEGGKRPRSSSGTSSDVLSALGKSRMTLLEVQFGDEKAGAEEAYAQCLAREIEWLRKGSAHSGVVQLYNRFAELYPASALAPKLLLELAKYYSEVMSAKEQSMETYTQLRGRYPDSSQAQLAYLHEGTLRYEQGQYDEAYALFQEFLAQKESHDKLATAKFLSALCESALGNQAEAEEHVEAILEAYAQDPVAPSALSWIASQAVARQDYPVALERFKELAEKYPNTSQAREASNYVKRLETMPK